MALRSTTTGFTARDVFLLKTPATFDCSIPEMWVPMYLGCTSVVVPDGEHLDFEVVRETMARAAVTVAHFVPSVLSLFLDFVSAGDLPDLRQISCTGEALLLSHREKLTKKLGRSLPLFNLYGPTPGDNGHWDGTPRCNGAMGPLQMCSSDTLPLEGRYHDGAILCDDGNATGHQCRGFIEATYTSDGVHPSNVSFFEYYQSNTDPPYVHVNRETTADGEELLSQVHERLITKHSAELKAAGLLDRALAQLPTNALLSMWDPKSPGFGAGTHGMNAAMIPGGAYAAGGAAGTVPAKSIKPFKTLDLFIANEAFHPADWGEGALEMAENVAAKFFGVAPPTWMAPHTYQHIMFGAPDAPPAPAPGPPSPPGPSPPGPAPPPAPPPTTCPAQTKLNASTVCAETVDMMTCSLEFSCPTKGEHFVKVDFASIGSPTGTCGAYTAGATCHGVDATTNSVVGKLCLGKSNCSVAPNTNVLNPANPSICDGVVKHTAIQLTCGTGPPQPPPPAPPAPGPKPPAPASNATKCTGPFGAALPPLLQNRPSGTKVPDFMVLAAPFTAFHANGSINADAVLPLAKLFKERLGITAVWVMGMRGQFDTLTVAERKQVAAAWVAAGKATGLFTIVQCGSTSTEEAAEVAAYVESIGGDAVASVGPFEELCSGTECVVDWVAPVAAAAPKTPFFYYHTPGWNGKSLNGVKMYDWFKYAATKIPTNVGVKFESYDDAEFKQTCGEYGEKKVMIYAPCNSLGHWNQGTPGRGAFIQAWAGPMCNRIKAAYEKGDTAQMTQEVSFMHDCQNAGGNFVERYFYGGYGVAGADFGPSRAPQPVETAASLASMNATLKKCGFWEQHWP